MSLPCPACGGSDGGLGLADAFGHPEKGDIMEIAAAIARGDCAAAAESLDHIARGSPTIAEWIAQGRASTLARPRAPSRVHAHARDERPAA